MKTQTKLTTLLTCLLLFSNAFGKQQNTAPEIAADQINMSFRDIPMLEEAFIDTTPADRKDDIPVGALGIDGGKQAPIEAFAREIAAGQHGKYDSLLIAHKGKLVFESYYHRGRVNLPHPQASATKGHTALILGRAMQLGYLDMTDLDRPVASFLKQLDPAQFVDGIEKITLRHALTMRGGLRLSDDQWEAIKAQTETIKGQGLVQTLFEQSAPITAKSQEFSYGNFNPNMVMQVIEAAVPGSAEEFIRDEFLNKLGITEYDWGHMVSGLPDAGADSGLTSRAMVKIGTLVMNQGRWQGEQLIPKAYIKAVTSPQVITGDEDFHYGGKNTSNQSYGLFWWGADYHHGNKTFYATSAQGGYGQIITLIKDLDLIIVSTGHDNGVAYLQLNAERILPAFLP